MKSSNTSERLKQIMIERGLRQVDILKMTEPYCKKYGVKMNKSDISQYCSGKVEPNQDKLYILGETLKVSEAWLMGYDVPIERGTIISLLELQKQAEEKTFQDFLDIIYTVGYEITPLGDDMYEIFSERYNWHFELSKSDLLELDKSIMNYVSYTTDKFMSEKYDEILTNSSTILNAAHQRTDIELPKGIDTSDNDIMDDDNF